MNRREVGMLFDRIIRLYPSFRLPESQEQQAATLMDWHAVLRHIDFQTASTNLDRYAANPDHKYAPHAGALAKPLKTDAERYHEQMRASGQMTLEEWERMKFNAASPPEMVREKVRRLAHVKRDGV